MTVEDRTPTESSALLSMTADVVAAYVGNHTTPVEALPQVIRSVHEKISDLASDHTTASTASQPAEKAAVPIKRSVTPDYLVCLEDGRKLKMLKRHLRTAYGLSPEQYRAKWGLPPDYPMVAPNYAAQRSAFAKKIGLGKHSGNARMQ